jgi:hypothetical protein
MSEGSWRIRVTTNRDITFSSPDSGFAPPEHAAMHQMTLDSIAGKTASCFESTFDPVIDRYPARSSGNQEKQHGGP